MMQEAIPRQRTLRTDLLFLFFCVIILTVSAADCYINLKYPIAAKWEENPVAQAVLNATGDDYFFLIAMKTFTTGLVMLIMTFLYFNRHDMGMAVAAVLAAVQVIIMVYMLI